MQVEKVHLSLMKNGVNEFKINCALFINFNWLKMTIIIS